MNHWKLNMNHFNINNLLIIFFQKDAFWVSSIYDIVLLQMPSNRILYHLIWPWLYPKLYKLLIQYSYAQKKCENNYPMYT